MNIGESITTNKKKLLILNGSHSDIPLIKAGKKLGYYVITTGNVPALVGHTYSDEYHYADFSNLQAILKLSIKLKIDAICSCANDFGAITASYVAEKLSLPGHDSYQNTLTLHHKDLFKSFASRNNIPTPAAKSFSNINEALSLVFHRNSSLIVKPIDLTGGKGITKVMSKIEYKKAVIKAFKISPQKRIVVEKFKTGTQHSFSSFIFKGKVVFYFSDNEYSYINPYLVTTSAAPSTNIKIVSKVLINITEEIVKLLSLNDGIFHIQYFYQNGKVEILEITRRCSGDLYPYPVNKSTGLDWSEWIVKAETGMNCSNFPNLKQKGYCGRHCIMSPRNGVLKNIHISSEIKNKIYDSVLWWKKGELIQNFSIRKYGILLLQYKSMSEMIDKTLRLNELVKVELEKN